MKKIKFMLMSLALLAVVGGALAFKAKYTQDWCSTTAAQVLGVSTCVVAGVNISCPNEAFDSRIGGTDNDINTFYCTTNPFNNGLCTRQVGTQVQTTTCGSPTFTTINGD